MEAGNYQEAIIRRVNRGADGRCGTDRRAIALTHPKNKNPAEAGFLDKANQESGFGALAGSRQATDSQKTDAKKSESGRFGDRV